MIVVCSPSAKRAPMRVKAINKPSFAKSGSDSYITGTLQLSVPENEKIYIFNGDRGIMWNAPIEVYSCNVASPKKESKLKGLKSFIVYQLTPSVCKFLFYFSSNFFEILFLPMMIKYQIPGVLSQF